MYAMNGKYATAACYICVAWHKVAYRSLNVTPVVGACGVLLIMVPCLTCWSCMCDGMLIETNAPPHVGYRVIVSSILQFRYPTVMFQAQRLSVCLSVLFMSAVQVFCRRNVQTVIC